MKHIRILKITSLFEKISKTQMDVKLRYYKLDNFFELSRLKIQYIAISGKGEAPCVEVPRQAEPLQIQLMLIPLQSQNRQFILYSILKLPNLCGLKVSA